MPTFTHSPATDADLPDTGVTGSRQARDPQQETVETPHGVEFLHAGSGNSLGDGRTAGGSANIAARDRLPDTNGSADDQEDGDGTPEAGAGAQP